ncbi:MAG: permease prefix domain 1-containing protein [Bifidobacterium subtile]|jgi:predicted transporter|nr:permease prefix domain 1-containing protein [Bifidobacterium subtile]MCI1241163.1 permease prefix domain 1-containing protein [Bifidobacterium subtile]MCI1258216.1 permease prefix domain 1-containing protein [Bifidobacterium subtile]
MNILDNYLDTMFSRYPLTTRTQEAKRELRAMMEDAYNGALAAGHSRNEAIGQAISEFGNLEEIAPALGLVDTEPAFARSRDFHESTGFHENTALRENTDLNESAGAPEDSGAPSAAAANASYAARQTAPHGRAGASAHGKAPASAYPVPEKRSITMAQARNYIAAMKRSRWLLGIGVALIVLGAAPFLGLATAYGSVGGTRENLSLLLGFALSLLLIGVGVGLLVYRSQQLSPFRRITSGLDRCTPEIAAYANAEQQQESSKRTLALVIAVMLWIVSALPLIGAGIFTQNWAQAQADPLLGLGMALTLAFVSLGLLVFLPANWMDSAQVHLTQTSPEAIAERDYDEDSAHYPVWVRAIYAGFWLIVTGIYLAWSFITGDWDFTWIIWPVSAIAFGAFAAITGTIYSSRERE